MRRSGIHARLGLVALLAIALGLACSQGEDVTGSASQPEEGAAAEGAAAAQPGPEAGQASGAASSGTNAHPVAVIRVKDLGEIRIELRPDLAPKTVENFTKLAESGFYDGTTFHRVIPGFMIQGGDPNTKDRDPRNDGYGGPGYTIPDEPNALKHVRGVISMANTGRPNTAGSQFFIVVKDAPHLDGGYTAFGRVIAGMDVVDQIVAVERDVYGRHGPRDRPLENVVVESIRIEAPGGGAEAPAG